MTPQVWLAEHSEAEAVARLMVEFRDWSGRDWPSDNAFLAGVERLIEDPATDYLLGSPDADTPPAGVAQLRFRHSLWTATDDCWLEDVYVRDEARGRGLGAALVDAAIEHARGRGCRRIELDVNTTNEPALALYERLGFSSRLKEPDGDNLFMQRYLDD